MSTRSRSKQGQHSLAAAPAQAAASAPPSTLELLRFATLQHGGLVLCIIGVVLLMVGYDAGWMHPTHLSLTCLGLCLAGLFMHETRPVNREEYFKQLVAGSAADNKED